MDLRIVDLAAIGLEIYNRAGDFHKLYLPSLFLPNALYFSHP